ncbi:hypothetical protein NIES25_02430 [Nostoc linckia NIES-25]|nr:hypothetical protein NIES25_02430 [Nostoc linckia NIES-25]
MLCPYDNLVFKYVFYPNEKRCKLTPMTAIKPLPKYLYQVESETL